MLADRAYLEKKNVIWDVTMASQESVEKRLNELKERSYTDA